MTSYVKPSLKKELLDMIQKFILDYPEYGYRSLSQFVEDAVRRRADELKVFELTPRFSDFNVLNDHATIEDKKLGRMVDVYVRRVGERVFELRCGYCNSTKCEHVRFTASAPEIMEPLKKRGWKYREG